MSLYCDASTIYRQQSLVKTSHSPVLHRRAFDSFRLPIPKQRSRLDGADRPARLGRAVRQHHPHAVHGRGPAGQLRPPRHADGARARRVSPLHAGDAALADAAGLARHATASSSPAAMRRCCSTRSSTSRATTCRSTRSSASASSARWPPVIPSTATRPGIETTTGPLGQGISTAVGMALAERMLAARFDREGHDVVDHRTYFIASDGDLEEGIASEASSHRRPPRPRPADRLLRRQPHLDRGRHGAVVLRGRRRALRGLRLARAEPRRGHRPGFARGRACAPRRRSRTGRA